MVAKNNPVCHHWVDDKPGYFIDNITNLDGDGRDTMDQKLYKKVIIASANVLFSKGLQKMLIDACQEKIQIVGMPSNLHEMLDQIEQHTPDIVVLDYDDKSLIRKDFLDYFITGQQPLRILLVSLQHTGLVTVYDRHSFTPSKVEDLLSVLL